MRAARLAISGLAAALLLAGAGAAEAQTTTVPPIPVTGGQTGTTTTAPAGTGTGTSGTLAETGVAADMLVPFGFALIASGAAMQAAARRRSRTAYGLL